MFMKRWATHAESTEADGVSGLMELLGEEVTAHRAASLYRYAPTCPTVQLASSNESSFLFVVCVEGGVGAWHPGRAASPNSACPQTPEFARQH